MQGTFAFEKNKPYKPSVHRLQKYCIVFELSSCTYQYVRRQKYCAVLRSIIDKDYQALSGISLFVEEYMHYFNILIFLFMLLSLDSWCQIQRWNPMQFIDNLSSIFLDFRRILSIYFSSADSGTFCWCPLSHRIQRHEPWCYLNSGVWLGEVHFN